MRVQFDGDIPKAIAGRSGHRLPKGMSELSQTDVLSRARWDGSNVVDAADFGSFFVSPDGRKHIVQHDPEWQPIECDFDDPLVLDSGSWKIQSASEVIAPSIKSECKRRIYAEIDAVAQINLASAAAGGLLSDASAKTYASGLKWIADMRAACADLIASADESYGDDDHWPKIPKSVRALVDKY